jgi:hypothetical protein
MVAGRAARYIRGVRVVMFIALLGCNASVDNSMRPPTTEDASSSNNGGEADLVRYRGTLATTQTVAFGGMGYCDYSVVLEDVAIDVVLRETEELAAMSIENTMTEGVVGTCPYAPQAPSRQIFSHESGHAVPLDADGKAEPALTGVVENRPMTNATSVVTVRNSAATATIRWERIDQGPPLKWVVTTTAPIAMQPQSCAPGANVCVGGAEGTLYTCADGMRMSVARICSAGCAASKTACK